MDSDYILKIELMSFTVRLIVSMKHKEDETKVFGNLTLVLPHTRTLCGIALQEGTDFFLLKNWETD